MDNPSISIKLNHNLINVHSSIHIELIAITLIIWSRLVIYSLILSIWIVTSLLVSSVLGILLCKNILPKLLILARIKHCSVSWLISKFPILLSQGNRLLIIILISLSSCCLLSWLWNFSFFLLILSSSIIQC